MTDQGSQFYANVAGKKKKRSIPVRGAAGRVGHPPDTGQGGPPPDQRQCGEAARHHPEGPGLVQRGVRCGHPRDEPGRPRLRAVPRPAGETRHRAARGPTQQQSRPHVPDLGEPGGARPSVCPEDAAQGGDRHGCAGQIGVPRGLIRARRHATVRSGAGCSCPAGWTTSVGRGRRAGGVEMARGDGAVAIRNPPKITHLSGNLPIEPMPAGGEILSVLRIF